MNYRTFSATNYGLIFVGCRKINEETLASKGADEKIWLVTSITTTVAS
jgi:hypothetical protein